MPSGKQTEEEWQADRRMPGEPPGQRRGGEREPQADTTLWESPCPLLRLLPCESGASRAEPAGEAAAMHLSVFGKESEAEESESAPREAA